MSSYLYAFIVELQPKEIVPGDVFFIKIKTNPKPSPEAPQVEFAGRTVELYQDHDNNYYALVPVAIDTAPQDYPVTIISADENELVHITVKPYKFQTKKITLPKEKVILSPQDQERAAREAELLAGLWPKNTPRIWRGRFTRPADTAISEVFGVKRIMNGEKTSIHQGLDFRGSTGTPVAAINSGTVVLMENLFFGGNTLVLDHGTGLYSVYMHLSKFNSSTGETVSKGQVVGLIGSTGRATGPHLHFGVKLLGVSVNPEALFKLEL